MEALIARGKLDHINAIDLSHAVSLTEDAIYEFIRQRGRVLQGLMVCGKPKLAEQFFLNVIPFMKHIRFVRLWRLLLSTSGQPYCFIRARASRVLTSAWHAQDYHDVICVVRMSVMTSSSLVQVCYDVSVTCACLINDVSVMWARLLWRQRDILGSVMTSIGHAHVVYDVSVPCVYLSWWQCDVRMFVMT